MNHIKIVCFSFCKHLSTNIKCHIHWNENKNQKLFVVVVVVACVLSTTPNSKLYIIDFWRVKLGTNYRHQQEYIYFVLLLFFLFIYSIFHFCLPLVLCCFTFCLFACESEKFSIFHTDTWAARWWAVLLSMA